MTIILSLMHLLVDCICLCSLYLASDRAMDYDNMIIAITSYNVLAFCTQPLWGAWVDKSKKQTSFVLISLVLLAAGGFCSLFLDANKLVLFAPTLLGLGNAIFHVWGGKQIIIHHGNNIRSLGLFVSTGAFGLSIGMMFCSTLLLLIVISLLISLAIGYTLYNKKDDTLYNKCNITTDDKRNDTLFNKRNHTTTNSDEVEISKTGIGIATVSVLLLVLMLIVSVRSFIGQQTSSLIHSPLPMMPLIVGGLGMLGKWMGGILAYRFGIVKVTSISFCITAIAFIWNDNGILLPLLALFAVNASMPITLWMANHLLAGREGLAFGLLAAALIPGFAFATTAHLLDYGTVAILAVSVVCLLCVLGITFIYKKYALPSPSHTDNSD